MTHSTLLGEIRFEAFLALSYAKSIVDIRDFTQNTTVTTTKALSRRSFMRRTMDRHEHSAPLYISSPSS